MALVIKTVSNTQEYIPVQERGEAKPTSFTFRLLTKQELALLSDDIVKMDTESSKLSIGNGSFILKAVKLGLQDVTNLIDEKKKEIKIYFDNKGEVDDNFLNLLPDGILNELGQVIISCSKDPNNLELYLGTAQKD